MGGEGDSLNPGLEARTGKEMQIGDSGLLVENVLYTCGHRGIRPSGKSQKPRVQVSVLLLVGQIQLTVSCPLSFCLSVYDGNRKS